MKYKHTGTTNCSCFKEYLASKNLTFFRLASMNIAKQVDTYEKIMKEYTDRCKNKLWTRYEQFVELRIQKLEQRDITADNTPVDEVKLPENPEFIITRKVPNLNEPTKNTN